MDWVESADCEFEDLAELDDAPVRVAADAFASDVPARSFSAAPAVEREVDAAREERVVWWDLSQPSPSLDLVDVLAKGRIVLVSLSPGQLGGPASRLLGALVLHQLFSAVQARSALPGAKRTPFLTYIDEPRVLADIPVPLDGLLERARGHAIGITIATQSLATMPKEVRSVAFDKCCDFGGVSSDRR